jgi:hypothetical protein
VARVALVARDRRRTSAPASPATASSVAHREPPCGAPDASHPARGASLGAAGGLTHAPFALHAKGPAQSALDPHLLRHTPLAAQAYGAQPTRRPSGNASVSPSQSTGTAVHAPSPLHSLPKGPAPTVQPAHEKPRA